MARALAIRATFCAVWTVSFALAAAPGEETLDRLIATIQGVSIEGGGNAAASRALSSIIAHDVRALPRLLTALDASNPIASNWIRAGIEAIADAELSRGGTLPAGELESFVKNRSHAARARRLAYELLLRVDKTASERLIPLMFDDPSPEMRRDAVARLVAEAERLSGESQGEKARVAYRKALAAARDRDQVSALVKRLRELGDVVDLPRHFGFLNNWKVIGPFDNTRSAAFDVVYPPEREININAEYDGKSARVRWIDHSTADDYGLIDLNKAFPEKPKGAIAYAVADFSATAEQDVEFRLGCVTAWKCWLNGNLVFDRDEYHRGIEMDQYRMPVRLRKGSNRILLKVCQNEQTEEWAQRWVFQFRICDATGTAVAAKE